MKFLLILLIFFNVVIGEDYTALTEDDELCCGNETNKPWTGHETVEKCHTNCMKDHPDSVGFSHVEGCVCCGELRAHANRGNSNYCSKWDNQVFRVNPKNENGECEKTCGSGVCMGDKCCTKASAQETNGVTTYDCWDSNRTNDGHSSGGNEFPSGPCPKKKCSDCEDRKTVRNFPRNNGVCVEVEGKRDGLGVCRYSDDGTTTTDCDWPRQVCYLGKCRTRVTPGTRGPGTEGPNTRGPKTRGPDTEGPKTRGPDTEGPKTRGPKTRGPDTEGPNSRGPGRRGPGKRGPGENGPGPRGKTPGGPGKRKKTPNGPGTEGPDTEGPGTRGPGTRGPSTRGPSTRGPRTEGPGTRGPSTEGPKTRGPETRGPNTEGPGTRGPSTEGPGRKRVHWCSHRHQDFHGVKCTGRWRYKPNNPTCVFCRNNGPECCVLASAETN